MTPFPLQDIFRSVHTSVVFTSEAKVMKRRRKEQAEGERRTAFEALITEASKPV